MKNSILKISLTAFAVFQSFLVLAQDYSGRHYTDDSSSSSSGMGFIVIIALVVVGFIIYGVIQSNSNKPKHNTPQSSSSGYKPQTIDDIRRQQAEDLQRRIDYLKQKDKEGDAALKGCIWALIIWGIIILGHFLFN
jgi:flagellar biosynthesis/type III secretory pathway M-ring protein FliF/YscJ